MRTLGFSLFCGVFGAVAASVLGRLAYGWLHAVRSDGWLDAFILLVCALPGLVWGLAVGAACARLVAGAPFKAGWIGLAVTLGGIVLVVGGVTASEYMAHQNTVPREARLDGRKLVLEFEIRLPPGREYPRDTAGWAFTLESGLEDGMVEQHALEILSGSARVEDGRAVLPGRAALVTTTWKNLLVTVATTVTTRQLRASGRPHRGELEWSAWRPETAQADMLELYKFQSRYRLQFAAEP